MTKAVQAASQPDNARTLEQLATTLRANLPGEQDLDELVHRVLIAMIEERGTPDRAARGDPQHSPNADGVVPAHPH